MLKIVKTMLATAGPRHWPGKPEAKPKNWKADAAALQIETEGRMWMRGLISALEKSCGGDPVLADQLFTYSLKEELQKAGMMEGESVLKKLPGKKMRLTDFGVTVEVD